MSWARFDDQFDINPDIDEHEIPAAALGLFVCCCTFCARNLTDGRVPAASLRKLPGGGDRKSLAALVGVGWLAVNEDGSYQVVQYLKYNPSAADVLAEREAAARRKRESRQRNSKADGRPDNPQSGSQCHAVTDGVTTTSCHDGSHTHPVPDPYPTPTPNPKNRKPVASSEGERGSAEGGADAPRSRRSGPVVAPVRPTLAEVQGVFDTEGQPSLAQGFYDHYQAKGWLKGSSPIVDLPSAARDWIRREPQFGVRARSTGSSARSLEDRLAGINRVLGGN